jgi:hypothetical protein
MDTIHETEDAIKRSEDHADQHWKECCLDTIEKLCKCMPTFSANNVWKAFRYLYPDVAETGTHSLLAVGPMLRRAALNGWCVNTGKRTRSNKTHGSLVTIWESKILLYKFQQ